MDWDSFNYFLTEDYLKKLSYLGATVAAGFSTHILSLVRRLILNCHAIRSGFADNCLVCDPIMEIGGPLLSFSTLPPVQTLKAGIYLLSEATEISISDFGLSAEIRFATKLAKSSCKSPDPVFVRSNDWTRFEFIGEHDFFKHPKVKAQELQLAPPTFSRNEEYEQPAPTLFVGKWTEQIEEILFRPFREFEMNYKPLT